MKIKVVAIVAMVAAAFVPAICLSAGVIVIAHPQVPVSILSKKDITNIFLGQKRLWDDKTKIILFTQDNTETHQLFLQENIRKTQRQFSHHWKKKVFTGKASQLRIVDSDQEMIKLVSETEGAIGYVSSDAQLKNVKTLSIN